MNEIRITSLRALSDNFIHVVQNDDEAIAIDPSSAGLVLEFLNSNSIALTHVLLTHHHTDHVAGAPELKAKTGCRIIGPDDKRISFIDTAVTQGIVPDMISELKVLKTPGHTIPHICFYFPLLDALFSGDTLFLGGCGRVLEGTTGQMWQSLLTLRRLPASTRIYPGHDYTLDNLEFCKSVLPRNDSISARIARIQQDGAPPYAPLSDELSTNVFLMCDDPEFASLTGVSGYPADIFSELRERKDYW